MTTLSKHTEVLKEFNETIFINTQEMVDAVQFFINLAEKIKGNKILDIVNENIPIDISGIPATRAILFYLTEEK